jgi:signal transduction histidine kinase
MAKKLGKIISQDKIILSPINLRDALNSSIDLVAKAYGASFIRSDLGPGDVLVEGDELIDEVFVNLLSNAVKYSKKEGGLVEIKVDRVEDGFVVDESKWASWRISITDHGRGIPDELKPQIFTRYLDAARGSGLGLSIVHALVVDRYGGRVRVRDRVENNYHEGTVIEVELRASS